MVIPVEATAKEQKEMTVIDDAALESWEDGDDIVVLVDWEEQ